MAINIAPKSLDTELSELMKDIASGKIQLPEFQRSWTWDDGRIREMKTSGLSAVQLKAQRILRRIQTILF